LPIVEAERVLGVDQMQVGELDEGGERRTPLLAPRLGRGEVLADDPLPAGPVAEPAEPELPAGVATFATVVPRVYGARAAGTLRKAPTGASAAALPAPAPGAPAAVVLVAASLSVGRRA
jgi:hypothetical protein